MLTPLAIFVPCWIKNTDQNVGGKYFTIFTESFMIFYLCIHTFELMIYPTITKMQHYIWHTIPCLLGKFCHI